MAVLGRAARSPHALAGRSMLGARELPAAALRPAVCAADLVCVPTAAAVPTSGVCTTAPTFAAVADSVAMTLGHPDAARADLQLSAWFFSLGGVTAGRVSDAVFASTTARRGAALGDNLLPCGAGVGGAGFVYACLVIHHVVDPRVLS